MNTKNGEVKASPRKRVSKAGKASGKKILAVMLATILALSTLSAVAFAEGLLGDASSAEAQAQSFSEGTISLDAPNAYIKAVSSTLDGKSPVGAGSNVKVPTSGNFVFSPQADTGFSVTSVKAYKTGDKNHRLAITQDTSGNSVIAASDLAAVGAVTLEVATTENLTEEVDAGAESLGEASEEPSSDAVAVEALAAGGIAPLSQALNGNELTLKVANDSNAFVDVDDIAHAITWPLSTTTKQIQVTAKFSDPNTTKGRSVTINVPRGYKILEYSATEGTAAPSGATKLGFSSTDEPKVASSALTAADGSDWTAQAVTGYAGEQKAADTARRTYDGKVAYTFNSNADTLTLTLTLGLDQYLMSHATGTDTLADITVDMQSGLDSLSENLSTTASMVVVPALNAAGASTAEGTEDPEDPTKGSVAEFRTNFSTTIYNAAAVGAQNHFAESATLTVSYPEGVTFAGFAEGVTATNPSAATTNTNPVDASTFTSQTYSNGHLVVTLDKVARTVMLEYTDVTERHSTNYYLFWTAEVDNSAIKWDQMLQFPARYNESSGLQTGQSEAHIERTGTSQVTVKRPFVSMTLTPSYASRSDLNAYAIAGTGEDYPYDYLLGGFSLNNASSSVVKDLLYEFSFSPNLAIRGFSLPGFTGNTYSKVEATTNTGRTIELGPYSVANSSQSASAVTVDSLKLGLAADEYLVSVKAWQDSLNAANYSSSYARSSIGYYGRFQAGQEGDVTLKISGVADPENPVVYVEKTGHTTIGSTQVGVGNTTLTATAPSSDDGTGTGSFYPSGTIKFAGNITAGAGTVTQESIIDPTVYLALPEGINLDASSVKATSVSGNHGFNSFALKQVGVSTKVVNGVTWNVYAFTSENPLDMVARPIQNFSADLQPSGYIEIKIVFDAKVSSSAATYTGLRAQDILQWDVGQKAVNSNGGSQAIAIADVANVTGKGTSYTVAAPTRSAELSIVQKPGLKVSLGIRTNGDTTPYYTYDGTEATVAPLTVDSGAQIWLEYENTAATAYFAGSEIYLPIPKTGKQYTNYFNDVVANPSSGSHDMRSPAWTGVLTGPISLPGFKTLYSTDTSVTTNDLAGATDSWVPTDISFSETAPGNWADVTMVKFVATSDIVSGAKGSTEFVMDVDDNAGLGQVDYWRAFQKGWTSATGAGSWVYGSVIAATPTMAGIEGMLYIDTNDNGVKDAGESFDPTAAGNSFTGVLTGTGITAQNLAFAADGSFKVVDSAGKVVHLKPGTYTINFTNATSGKVGFSSKEVPNVSDGTAWGMDISQANIAYNHSTASYTFTVDSTMAAEYILYMGVALRSAYTVSYTAGTGLATGTTFDPATEMVVDGLQPKSNPVIASAHAKPGYDYTSAGWKADKEVTLTDGTVIPANTRMTTAQLRMVKVTEDLSFVVTLDPIVYTVSYDLAGGTAGSPANPETYTVESAAFTLTNPTRDGYTFAGWTGTDLGSATLSVTVAQGSTGNKAYTATWTAKSYTLSFDKNATAAVAGSTTSKTVTYDSEVGVLPGIGTGAPTRTGYTFQGWATEATAETANFTATNTWTTIGDGTVYAVWQANTNTPYAVEHYKADSQGTAAATPFATESLTGETDTTANATVKSDVTGYTHDASFAGTKLSGNIAGDGSLVLKVYYQANNYTVAFDANGGTGAPSDITVATDETLTIPSTLPTRAGYNFVAWNTTSDGTGAGYNAGASSIWTETSNITLYAQWTPASGIAYKVEHYLVSGSTARLQLTENLTGTTDSTVSAQVKSFTGYTHNSSYPGTALSGTVAGNGSLVLRAYYSINTYTVRFLDFDGRTLATQSVNYGDSATAPSNPSRTGYTFAGWDTSFNFITSNLTVRALYNQLPTYIVSYDGNGNTGGTAPTDAISYLAGGSATVLGKASLTRTGHTFEGWATSANGSVAYKEGDTLTIKGNVTLYAVWDGETIFIPSAETGFEDGDTGITTTTSESSGVSSMNIFGNEVPLFGSNGTLSWSLFNLAVTILTALALVISVLRFALARKGKEYDAEKTSKARFNKDAGAYDSTEKLTYRRAPFFIISLVAAVLAVILFFLTQDLSAQMVIFDMWSVAFGVILIVALVAVILVAHKKEEKTSFGKQDVSRVLNAQ